ncbi:hypothetical protein ABVD55_001180 [Vibrio harveyi]
MLIATVGGSTYAETDRWLLILLATLTVVSVILYVFAYIYFMFKNPDALRSEKFNIEKMAIQKGIVGDSQLGVIEQNSASNDIEANEDHDSFSSNSLGHK